MPKLPPLPKYVKNDYDDGWSSEAAKPYEHAESEEEATVWNDEAWEKEKKKNYTSVHRSSTYSSDCYEGRRNEYLPNNDAEAEQFKKDQAKFASFGEMQEMDGYSQARWGEVKSSDTGLDSVEAEADKKREWLSFKALFKKKIKGATSESDIINRQDKEVPTKGAEALYTKKIGKGRQGRRRQTSRRTYHGYNNQHEHDCLSGIVKRITSKFSVKQELVSLVQR